MQVKPLGGCVRPERATISVGSGAFSFLSIYNQLIFASGATITGLSTLILGTVTASTVIAALLQAVSAQIGVLIADSITALSATITSLSVSTLSASSIDSGSAVVTGSVTLGTLRVSNAFNSNNGPVVSVLNSSRPYTGNVYQIGSSFGASSYIDGNLFANPEPVGLSVSYNVPSFTLFVGTSVWGNRAGVYTQTYGRLGVGTFVSGVFTPAYAGMYHFNPVFCCLSPSTTQFDVTYTNSYIGSTRYLGSVTRNNNLFNTQTPFVTYMRAGDTCVVEVIVIGGSALFQSSTAGAGNAFNTSRLEIWRTA